jgi:hypothetical protein
MNKSSHQPTYNIFQEGLISGSNTFRRSPHKEYAYVEHPTEGWRVYLRSCAFIHDITDARPDKFIVVKDTRTAKHGYAWEPPKGQMEGKDIIKSNSIAVNQLISSLQNNIIREVQEESKLPGLLDLRFTGMVYQGREKEYPENHVFQYIIFVGAITPDQFYYAKGRFDYYKENPSEFKELVKDQQEKNDIAWYKLDKKRLFGRWSPSIVMLYLNSFNAS